MKLDQKKYGIGIVGCGSISETHAEAISQTTKGRLIAAHSRTSSTLEMFCSRRDIVAYPVYKEFLENPDLDIVVICTPTGTHLDYGKLAAEAGKHVIIEKPIEITVERGYSLIQTCKNNDVKLAIIYQNRFIEGAVCLKKCIDHQDIGFPIMARGSVKWFRDQEYYSNSSWRGTFALDGGGAVINQSIHTIDLMQWLLGPIESVSGFIDTFTHKALEAEDNAVACMRFKSGTIGTFEASTSVVPPQERKIVVNGSEGTAILDGDKFYKKLKDQMDQHKPKDDTADSAGAASPLAGMTAQNHKKQYEQILNAFQSDNEPIVSGRESLESLAIVEALYKSAERKELVYIEEILSGKL